MKRIAEKGGTPQCEEAVVKSLRWLKKQQNGNGSWGEGQCRASMTGISLLAYLAHCETPLSEEFGENVLKLSLIHIYGPFHGAGPGQEVLENGASRGIGKVAQELDGSFRKQSRCV